MQNNYFISFIELKKYYLFTINFAKTRLKVTIKFFTRELNLIFKTVFILI